MNSVNLDQYFKICRACLSESQDTFSLFNKIDFLDVEVATVLSYFNINVTADETYPDVICSACYNTVIAFYKFWKTYNTSQKILSGQLGPYVSPESNEITIIIEEDDCDTDKVNSFMCPKCVVSFKFFNSLSRHMRRYHETDTICCHVCQTDIEGSNAFLDHFRTEHKPKRSKTEIVEYVSTSLTEEEDVKVAPESLIVNELYSCPLCNIELESFKFFSTHVKHHNANEIPCNQCEKHFEKDDEFLNHYDMKHRFECKECAVSFRKKENYKRHMIKHKKRTYDGDEASVLNKQRKIEVIPYETEVAESEEDPEYYLCPICYESIERFELFAEHVLIHDEKGINCNYCHDQCANSEAFVEHFKEKHKNECKICQEVFEDKAALIKHIKSHNIAELSPEDLDPQTSIKTELGDYEKAKEEIIECPVCKKQIEGFHVFARHVTEHEVEMVQCSDCNEQFEKTYDFVDHYKMRHRFQCKKCDISYLRRDNLERHLIRHQKVNVGPFICEIEGCGKKYSSHYAFSRHRLQHEFPQIFEQEEKIKEYVQKGMENKDNELMVYQCPLCNNQLDTIALFSKHMAEHKSFKIPCNLCTMKFTDSQSFIKHYKSKHRFQCKTCNASYNRKDSLLRHMTKHDSNNTQIFYCPVEGCNRKYQSIHALTNHSYIHDTKLNFTCHICQDSFLTPDALRHHRKSKHETPRHLCVHCGRAFVAISHLKDHMWQHTGVKPFVCDRCGRDFTRKQQMVKHLKHYCGHNRRRPRPEAYVIIDANVQDENEETMEESITEIYEEQIEKTEPDVEGFYEVHEITT